MKNLNYRPQYEKSWALVIGINRYQHTNPLANACADATSVAEILVGELGFPKENVFLLLDDQATRPKIMERFLAFESLSADDRLFVFFAGHGATVTGQRGPVGYLVPVDGKYGDKSTLIRWDELTRNAEIIPAKHVLFVMDACYSGLAIQRSTAAGEQRFVSDMLQRFSRQVITAGKEDEAVADGGGPTGKNSIFTGHLLEGLRGKAANENGVLTASYLMNYVYQKVANDPRSGQTPHFGHLEGDGDFILLTPKGEHLPGGPAGDFLVKGIVERPEPVLEISFPTVKPVFAERNGYVDPESDSFGRNEWSNKLGAYRSDEQGGIVLVRPSCWLSLVVEPVSNQPINFDVANLAKTLPQQHPKSDSPWERFSLPHEAVTTAKSAILFDSDYAEGRRDRDCWKRFFRVEKHGAMEYCDFVGATGMYAPPKGSTRILFFRYIQTVGLIWTFLYAMKHIFNLADYQAGVRLLVNLIGTRETVLAQFAGGQGKEGKYWRQPFDMEAMIGGSLENWRCRDANLQIPFQLVLGSLGEAEAKRLVMGCAEQLGLAYNHQSQPRCFTFGTDEFPWRQFSTEY